MNVDTCLEKGLKGAGEEVEGDLLRIKLSGGGGTGVTEHTDTVLKDSHSSEETEN